VSISTHFECFRPEPEEKMVRFVGTPSERGELLIGGWPKRLALGHPAGDLSPRA
jgi:hypothetical protein